MDRHITALAAPASRSAGLPAGPPASSRHLTTNTEIPLPNSTAAPDDEQGMTVPHLTIHPGNTAVPTFVFDVHAGDAAVGTVAISREAIVWTGRESTADCRLTWGEFSSFISSRK